MENDQKNDAKKNRSLQQLRREEEEQLAAEKAKQSKDGTVPKMKKA